MLYKLVLAAGLAAGLAAQTPKSAAGAAANAPSYLGVWVWEIDSARAQQLRLPETVGVEITRVRDESPAAEAGLRPGDVVTRYDGQRVDGIDQFSNLVRETPVGKNVTLQIFRGGAPQMVSAKIASSAGLTPAPGAVTRGPAIVVPDLPRSMTTWRSPVLGVDAEALEGQLAAYFGVKEGILVRSVVPGSAAEKAGIKAGDVIVRVDGRGVATPADVTAQLRTLQVKSVVVVLLRDHREMTLTVALDDDRARCCPHSGVRERL